MKTKDIQFLLSRLKDRYPDVKTQLVHQTPFQLLTATILSAQCTDRQVNQVTGHLFERFPDPASLAAADLKDIKKLFFPRVSTTTRPKISRPVQTPCWIVMTDRCPLIWIFW